MSKICAVIPAYNAEKTIAGLVCEVSRYVDNVVVVDDGSVDKTSDVAFKAGAVVLRCEKNSGKGKALKTGFKFALENGFELILTLDADFQHNPKRIPDFVSKLGEGYDIVIGNRRKKPGVMPLERIFSNITTSFLITLRTGVKVPDSQCGFRLIKNYVIENINAKSDGFVFESEFLIKALLMGYRVGFVDIETIYNGERSYIRHIYDTVEFIKLYLKSFYSDEFKNSGGERFGKV